MHNIIYIILLSIFSYGEYINNYNVSVYIENNGSLNITEVIDYDFEENSRHGIYRDIPYEVKIDDMLMDIGLNDINITQDNKNVPWRKNFLYKVPKVLHLQIGEKRKKITGLHRYRIGYQIDYGVLPTQEQATDTMSMNVIGSGWNIPIKQAEIELVLPTSLEQGDVNISATMGLFKRPVSIENIVWVDKKKVRITIDNLPSYRSVTVTLNYISGILGQTSFQTYSKMKQRYIAQKIAKAKSLKIEEDKIQKYNEAHLIYTGKYINQWNNIYILNWILVHFNLIIFSFLIYLIYIYKFFDFSIFSYNALVVRYTPPKGLSLLQSGILLDKYADSEDIEAAIVELVILKYIAVEEDGEVLQLKRLSQNTNHLSEDQRYILEEILFKTSDTISLKEYDAALTKRVSKGIAYLQKILYQWAVSKKYIKEHTGKILNHFLKSNTIVFFSLYCLMYYILYLTSSLPKYDLLMLSLVPLIAGIIGVLGGSSFRIGVKYTPYLWFVSWILLLFIAYNYKGDDIFEKELILLFVMSGVSLILQFLSYSRMGKFTLKGKKIQQHLLGLRRFILRANKDRIERLLKKDTFYLEEMLPYAMLYGEAEIWIQKLELLSKNVSKDHIFSLNQVQLRRLLKVQKKIFDTATSHSTTSYYNKNSSSSVSSSSGSNYGSGSVGGGGGGSW